MTASRQTAARLTAERRAGEGSQAFWTLIKTLAFLLSRRRGVRGRYHCWIAGLCFTKLMVACSISTCHDSLLAVPLCAMEFSAQCRWLTAGMLSEQVFHGQRTISRLTLFNITPPTSHPTRLTISNAFTTLTRCKAQLLQTIHMHSQSSAATNALPLEYVGRYAPDKRDQENRGPCCQKTKKGKTPKSMQDAIRESRTPYPIRSVIRQTDQPEPDAAL